MSNLTSHEIVEATLNFKRVPRLARHISLWDRTRDKYVQEGRLQPDEDVYTHFETDFRCGGWMKCVANLDHEEQIVNEDEDTVTVLDGNGATLRRKKHGEYTPEHIDFQVKDRATWHAYAAPYLKALDRRRIPFDEYKQQRNRAAEEQRYFFWHGIGPFELMHPVFGHENLLMCMALEPEFIKEVARTYVDFSLMHQQALFAECGTPDAVFYYDDMGFKFKPFMSPAMYRDILQPEHKRLFDYAHSRGCKVIVHSCGFIEPLVPGLIEAGMDCLQAMEVKAGMNLPDLFDRFKDAIAFFGGFDVRTLISNDRDQIDQEFKKVKYVVENGGSYILHSDHSEPPEIDYETIRYFLSKSTTLAKTQ